MSDAEKTGRTKKPPAYKAFFVLGLAFIAIGISSNTGLIGVGVVFMIIGAAGMAKQRKKPPVDPDEPVPPDPPPV